MTIELEDTSPFRSSVPVDPGPRPTHQLAPGTEVTLIQPGSDEWYTTVSASKIAAIAGVSQYDSPRSLFDKMLGIVAPQAEDDVMRAGHYLEPACAAWFRDQHPDWVVRPCGTFISAANPRWTAAPDRIVHKPDLEVTDLVEIKSSRKPDMWGTPGTDQIPDDYKLQAQWQMHVAGTVRCHFAVITQFLDFTEYVVDYDPTVAAQLAAQADAFLALIDTRTPPPIDGHKATLAAVAAENPLVAEQAVIHVDEPLARRYVTTRTAAAAAAAAENEAKARLLDGMGDARVAKYDGKVLARRQQKNSGTPYLVAGTKLPDFDDAPDTHEPGLVLVPAELLNRILDDTPEAGVDDDLVDALRATLTTPAAAPEPAPKRTLGDIKADLKLATGSNDEAPSPDPVTTTAGDGGEPPAVTIADPVEPDEAAQDVAVTSPEADATGAIPDGDTTLLLAELNAAMVADRETWLLDRIANLKIEYPERVDGLKQDWIRTGIALRPPWTDPQIDTLSDLVAHAEPSFTGNDPAVTAAQAETIATQLHPQPPTGPVYPDVNDPGDVVSDADATELRTTIANLPGDQLDTLRAWAGDAKKADRPWSTGATLTAREWTVAHAAIACLRAFPAGRRHERTTGALAYILGSDLPDDWRLGPTLGSLTLDEARQLEDTAGAYRAKDPTIRAVIDSFATAAA